MGIKEQFNQVATEYDAARRLFIPCFDDFYGATTDFIAANIAKPKKVMDLGAGTGLLTSYWRRIFGGAEYHLVDVADKMLDVARKRFANAAGVKFDVLDYRKSLPDSDFDCVISALSIHHLEDDEKRSLFSSIYEKLPDGGSFANYDQFCAFSPEMKVWFDKYWIDGLEKSGLSQSDLDQWRKRRTLDREISVETELKMLRDCNFRAVECVYSMQKFAVIVARK